MPKTPDAPISFEPVLAVERGPVRIRGECG